MKPWETVSAMVKECEGAPVVSCVLMAMLYWPLAAVLGALMIAEKFTALVGVTVRGLADDSVQVAPVSALASQVTFILPL